MDSKKDEDNGIITTLYPYLLHLGRYSRPPIPYWYRLWTTTIKKKDMESISTLGGSHTGSSNVLALNVLISTLYLD